MEYDPATWGTVSDWLSSVSTALTLGIAVMAYKKAPDWIKQHYHKEGLTIVIKVIDVDIPKTKKDLISLGKILSTYQLLINEKNFDITKIQKNKLDELSKNIFNEGMSLFSSFMMLEKIGWNLKRSYNQRKLDAVSAGVFILSYMRDLQDISQEFIDYDHSTAESKQGDELSNIYKIKKLIEDTLEQVTLMSNWLILFMKPSQYDSFFNIIK